MREPPLFSLIYTSVRPQCIWNRCHTWLTKAAKPELVEINIATDADDTASAKAARSACLTLPGVYHRVQPDPDGDCVKGWNCAAGMVNGQIVVQMSDDFTPPINWDSLLVNLSCEHGGKWWEHDHAVHVNDAFVVNIMTLGIITRVRLDRYGYFYNPLYRSMFADTELTDVAYQDKVVINAKHLVFEHHHYNRNGRPMDSADARHGSSERWREAETLYNQRKAAGFPFTPVPSTTPGHGL